MFDRRMHKNVLRTCATSMRMCGNNAVLENELAFVLCSMSWLHNLLVGRVSATQVEHAEGGSSSLSPSALHVFTVGGSECLRSFSRKVFNIVLPAPAFFFPSRRAFLAPCLGGGTCVQKRHRQQYPQTTTASADRLAGTLGPRHLLQSHHQSSSSSSSVST